jgi:hypothetical protein
MEPQFSAPEDYSDLFDDRDWWDQDTVGHHRSRRDIPNPKKECIACDTPTPAFQCRHAPGPRKPRLSLFGRPTALFDGRVDRLHHLLVC